MMSETELKFAKRAIAQIALMGGEHTQQLLTYIKLFSAPENPLSLEQTYEILMTVADFWATYPAQAWQIAVNKLLAQHRSGSLKTPLLNHDLLINEMEQVAQFTDHATAQHRAQVARPTQAQKTYPRKQTVRQSMRIANDGAT